MQYVFFVIFLGLLAYDIKKGILIYAPYKFFFLSSIKIWGAYSFDAVFSLVAVTIFFLRYNDGKSKIEIPWKYGILFGITAVVLNSFFSENSLALIWNIFTIFLYAVVYFNCIDGKVNLQVAIHSIIIFCLIMCVNGVIEYQSGTNFLREIQQSISVKDAYFSDNDIERFGITHRVCSCIPHSIGFGTVCACFFFIIFYIVYTTKMHLNLLIVCVTMMLLAIGLILSASRSPLLGFAVMALPFFISKETLKIRNLFLLGLMLTIAFYFAGGFLFQMFYSIINETQAAEASGSDIEMRQTQYELTMVIWSQNPIWGYGSVALEQIDKAGLIRGAESLWLQLLIRRGVVGFIGCILFYFFVLVDIYKKQKEWKFKFAFWCGWIVINTVTSLPGLSDFLALMILCLMYKIEYFGYSNLTERRQINVNYHKKSNFHLMGS